MDLDSAPPIAYFDIPMEIMNVRICKGFDRENRSGCTPSVILHPQSLFTVEPLIDFQICYPQHRFQIFKKLGVKFYDLFL